MKDLFLAVGKLSIGIERIFLLGEKVGLGTLLCLTDLGGLFRTGQNGLQGFQVSVKIEYQLLRHYFSRGAGCILIVQFGLGLPLQSVAPGA